MDDLCVYSPKSEHIKCLRHVLARCKLYGISLNHLKCELMVTHGVVLGHVVSIRGITTHDDKVKFILELEPPTSSKGVQVFMGHMNYYSHFMKDYASIVKPMFNLIEKFEWREEATIAFEKLKRLLAFAPILRSLDWNVIFHV